MKKFLKILAFLFVAFVGLIACNGNKQGNGNDVGANIKIDGSSTVYPITEAIAEEFKKESPDVQVTIGVSGTGGGFKKFGRGEIDISDASRAIKDKEAADCKANNIGFIDLEIAYDGMAVVVNPKNTWAKDITVAELKKLWEPAAQGKIMKWNQIRAEWPDKEIHLFGPGTASGTYDYFTEAIVGKSGSSRGDYTASEDDNVLVQGIKNDEYALGFFGLAYYEENMDALKLVPIDNGKGAVLPSVATILDKTYTPLSRPLFIYVNTKALERKDVVDFVNFYLQNVKSITKEVGYIPLQDEMYKQMQDKFQAFLKEHTAGK